MKKIFFFCFLLLSFTAVFSQNRYTLKGALLGTLQSSDTATPVNVTVAQLRAATGITAGKTINITDPGRQGTFRQGVASFDDGGTQFNTADNKTFYRQGYTQIEGSWFGMVGDGVTDNLAAFNKFKLLGLNTKLHIGKGKWLFSDTTQLPSWINVEFFGDGDSTEILTSTKPGIFYPGNMYNVRWHDMYLHSTYSNATLDFSHGLIYSFGQQNYNVEIYKLRCEMPSANASAINFLVQSPTGPSAWINKGSINGMWMHDNLVQNMGQSALTVLNRDTITVGSRGRDSCINVAIINNTIKNLGLSGSFGIGLTLDGTMNGGRVQYNRFYNCFDICIENTGSDNFDFGWNLIFGSTTGRTTAGFGFSTRPWDNNTIHDNICVDSMPGGNSFIGGTNSHFRNNVFIGRGTGYCAFRNCFNLDSYEDKFSSNYLYAVQIISTSGNTSTKCSFVESYIDNSTSGTVNACISFDGVGTTNNVFKNPHVKKGTGGTFTGQQNSAATNYIIGLANAALTTDFYAAYQSITLTATANDTLINDLDNIDIRCYKFTASPALTATVNIYFTNLVHSNFTINNRCTQDLNIILISSGSSVLVKVGQKVTIFNDGTNLVALNIFTDTYLTDTGSPLWLSNRHIFFNTSGEMVNKTGTSTSATDYTNTYQYKTPFGGSPFVFNGVRTSPVVNPTLYNIFRFDMTGGNITMPAPSSFADGQKIVIELKKDSTTGTGNATWNATYKFPNVGAPIMSTSPKAVDFYEFIYDTASTSPNGAGWYNTNFQRGDGDGVKLPTATLGTGAGTGSSFTITGTDKAGTILLGTGLTPGTVSTIMTMTYSVTYPNGSAVILFPANSLTALLTGAFMVYTTGNTHTMLITSGASALTASSNYLWNYIIIGY